MHAALIILKIYGIKYFKIVFLNIYNCVYKIPFSKSGHILMFSYVCYIIYQGLFMSCRKQHLLKHYKPVYDSFSVDKDTCTLLESPFHTEMNGFVPTPFSTVSVHYDRILYLSILTIPLGTCKEA